MKLAAVRPSLPTLDSPGSLVTCQPTESEPGAFRSSFVGDIEQIPHNQATQGEPSKELSPNLHPLEKRQRTTGEVFGSTFLTIFLAEFGDKTQLSTLLMSAESQSPWVVFLGAAAAMITTSLLGVLLGRWLATKLTPRTLETAAGVSMLLISVMLLWDVVQL
jgi:putative Ca2+/H+ antiporter (TMEM165/GDT1 family)